MRARGRGNLLFAGAWIAYLIPIYVLLGTFGAYIADPHPNWPEYLAFVLMGPGKWIVLAFAAGTSFILVTLHLLLFLPLKARVELPPPSVLLHCSFWVSLPLVLCSPAWVIFVGTQTACNVLSPGPSTGLIQVALWSLRIVPAGGVLLFCVALRRSFPVTDDEG